MAKDFSKCNTHIDCFANKEGYCIALKSEGFSDVACTFYKTEQGAEEARIKSYKHLVTKGHKDLIEKYGGQKSYEH